jgi:hypothetical protein
MRFAPASALDRALSDLVNQSYGLTPPEIALMWQTAPPPPHPRKDGLSSRQEACKQMRVGSAYSISAAVKDWKRRRGGEERAGERLKDKG